jgi:hypothetical protein
LIPARDELNVRANRRATRASRRATAINKLTCGAQIEVYWSEEDTFYECTVSNIQDNLYTFDYNDGDSEIHQRCGGSLFLSEWIGNHGKSDNTGSNVETVWRFLEVSVVHLLQFYAFNPLTNNQFRNLKMYLAPNLPQTMILTSNPVMLTTTMILTSDPVMLTTTVILTSNPVMFKMITRSHQALASMPMVWSPKHWVSIML